MAKAHNSDPRLSPLIAGLFAGPDVNCANEACDTGSTVVPFRSNERSFCEQATLAFANKRIQIRLKINRGSISFLVQQSLSVGWLPLLCLLHVAYCSEGTELSLYLTVCVEWASVPVLIVSIGMAFVPDWGGPSSY